ncbi:MAG TPA: PSD1 and planctomycete cytochrome C domain-containing protein [Vicinamibacteria bacterium]
MKPRLKALWCAVACALFVLDGRLPEAAAGARPAPDFERDIRPILEANCVSCHGPKQQESLLRLDTRGQALKGGMSGAVIVPGKSRESPLVQHLRGELTPRMPNEKPPLAGAEIARIAAWIDAGAVGPDEAPGGPEPAKHWAYQRPQRPPLPSVRDRGWVKTPIDAFVLARLEHEQLEPSPEASRETLVRRLSLDLVGLPPTPQEVDAFVNDTSPGAYAAVVDRLLASPRYGERWARPWLDLARYADTNGYEKDQRRTAWKYRDWVIDALNRDLSFRDFTIEQLAGDMLKDATVEQKIATGFNRNSQLNQEGGIDVEEYRFETLVDRVATTSTVWLGSTLQCAQCHNHKFDPFPQQDYYRFMAFFDNGAYAVHGQGEEVVDKWIVEPELELATPEQARRREALRREGEDLRFELDKRELAADLAAFESAISGPAAAFTTLAPVRVAAKGSVTSETLADGSLRVLGKPEDKESYTVTVRTRLGAITAFRLEALPDPLLPQQGPGRESSGSFVLTSLSVKEGERALPLKSAAADFNEKGRTAALAIDSHPSTGWGVTAEAEVGRPHALVVTLERPLAAAPPKGASEPAARTLTFTLGFQSGWPHPQASLGRFRLSATAAPRPFAGLPLPEDVRPLVATAAGERTPEQKQKLDAWFRPIAPSLDAARDRTRAIQDELDDMKVVTTLVMQERPGFERPSTLLRNKGSFTNPGERVYAALPSALGALAEELPPNRLGLARWLASDRNPLTARVTVNRLWEALFGRGLVRTLEDFGSQGERPSHPELLDWLAVEFMEKGWSQKQMLRTIVSSASYRQSSDVSPALLERDPDNRLLARGARYRVEAEMVRDIALAASGLLAEKLGGPSVYPQQPDGVWNVPYSEMKWETSAGEDLHRRSLYTFYRRSSPYPGLVTFDAPSREMCTVRRVRTDTPLQALTTLNDPVFVEAARALAQRMAREGGTRAAERIAYGQRLCTARRPAEPDLDTLVAFFGREKARFTGDAAAARSVAGLPEPVPGSVLPESPAEAAALTMVANVLLNLDATITRE